MLHSDETNILLKREKVFDARVRNTRARSTRYKKPQKLLYDSWVGRSSGGVHLFLRLRSPWCAMHTFPYKVTRFCGLGIIGHLHTTNETFRCLGNKVIYGRRRDESKQIARDMSVCRCTSKHTYSQSMRTLHCSRK